jgi:hypothetical protein
MIYVIHPTKRQLLTFNGKAYCCRSISTRRFELVWVSRCAPNSRPAGGGIGNAGTAFVDVHRSFVYCWQDAMIPSSSALSSRAFATPEAGFDYFAVEAHCRSLARRIIAALGGFSVVVVTGDPPASARLLSAALSEAAAGSRHLASPLLYAPVQGRHDLLHFRRALSASLASRRDTGGEPGSATRASPLVIFDNVDRLSDEQIEEVFKQICDHRIGAAVVLARPDFLARLERPALRFWLAKRLLVARLRVRELGSDEVPAFIRHQLRSGEGEGLFTDEAMTAIANVSGGDPTVVNRFSRRLLDIAVATTGDRLPRAVVTPAAVPPTVTPIEDHGLPMLEEPAWQPTAKAQLGSLPSTPKWGGRGAALKLSASIAFCLACFGAVAALVVPRAEEKIVVSSTPVNKAAAGIPKGWTSTGEVVLSGAVVATNDAPMSGAPPEELARSPAKLAPTAASAPAGAPQRKAPLPTTAAVAASLDGTTPRASAASPTATAPTAAAPSTSISEGTSTISAPIPATSQATPRSSAAEIAALAARGDRMLALGDIASARLFYERAADAGEGQAALKLAKTFDPVFLYLAHLNTVRGDLKMAAYWYRRARDLGIDEAR